jgi:hypothetical protein
MREIDGKPRGRRVVAGLLLGGTMTLAGCAGFDDTSVRRTGATAAVGGASGAIIGAMVGSPGTGAAIGATAGGTAGYLYDQISKERRGY